MKQLSLIIIFAFFWAIPSVSFAQEARSVSDGEDKQQDIPLEITADYSLEWDRTNKKFIANTNAIAKQGDTMISADTLTAYYREENGKSMDLYKMTAEGNVTIKSKESVAYGDNAEYNIDEDRAVMTGQNLKMVSDDQTLTAQDNFEYWVTEGRLVANGAVKIVRPKENKSGQDVLEAKVVTAIMKENAQGKRVFDTLTAKNAIKITTPTEVLTGNYGTYKAARNIAEITGNVKISRGKNILQGEKAVVDLNTNVSRMFGQSTAGSTGGVKRVRGVFYPGSQKKKSTAPAATKTPEVKTGAGIDNTATPTTQTPIKLTPPAQNPAASATTGLKRIQAVRPSAKRSTATSPASLQETQEQAPTPLLVVPGNAEPSRLLTAPTNPPEENQSAPTGNE